MAEIRLVESAASFGLAKVYFGLYPTHPINRSFLPIHAAAIKMHRVVIAIEAFVHASPSYSTPFDRQLKQVGQIRSERLASALDWPPE
jgi:hypothetical protein